MNSILKLLLEVVPLIPGWIQAGKATVSLYDTVQNVIAENRKPSEPEWTELENMIAADMAAINDTSRDV